MKALIFHQTGEPLDVLSLQKLPDPMPSAGEVLVRVLVTPIHTGDLHVLRGRFGRQPSLPASPGFECVGIVEAVGTGTESVPVGSRVVLVDVPGTWRELILCPVERIVLVPDAVSDEAAAQAVINPVTAWALTMAEHHLKPADWLAQTAAGSTVGKLVLQLARSEGFRTINLVRRREQVNEIFKLGGDVAICTEDTDWAAQVTKAAGPSGLERSIDCVAGRVGADLVRMLVPGSKSIVYGALSSHRQTEQTAYEMPLFTPRLIYASVEVQGWFLFRWLATNPLSNSVAIIEDLLNRFATGSLQLPPAELFRPEAIKDAIAATGSAQQGKSLIDFRQHPAG